MANDNYYDDATVAGWSLNGAGWNTMSAITRAFELGTYTATFASVTSTGNIVYGGQSYSAPYELTDGATITPNWDNGDNQYVELAGNRTIANPSNINAGATYTLTIIQDSTGTRTASWGTYYKWAGGTAPTLSTDGDAIDLVTIYAKSSTELLCVWSGDFS